MEKEMEVVKRGMQHGDLSLDAYTQVCFLNSKTVFFWPLGSGSEIICMDPDSEPYFKKQKN
jgi:hypothetical protein